MSFQAISWAIAQDIPRTSEKFLLVMLANYADNQGYCYPSIDRLAMELSQDRKTVVKSMKSLMNYGFIRDSGKRVGRTKSVIVYQLVGIPSSHKFHYLYRVENIDTGEYYYGTRSTNIFPHMDEYTGSGQWCYEMRKKGIFLHKQIIEIFPNYEDCRSAESRIFKSLKADDGLCKNGQASFYAQRKATELNAMYKSKGIVVFDGTGDTPQIEPWYEPEAVPILEKAMPFLGG